MYKFSMRYLKRAPSIHMLSTDLLTGLKKEIIMATVFEVANFFLGMEENNDSDITNLKLQKLCYYAQGVFMALNDGQPLFDEELVKWDHGPVCKALYHEYKAHGSNVIPAPENKGGNVFTPEQLDVLEDVYSYFGQFSAWKLRNMTHEEDPWLGTKDSEVIKKEDIYSYFKNHVIDG